MSGVERSTGTNREVAHRIFATEYEAADYAFSESEEDRAPNYVITPTGARINRLFVVGVLTEVEQVGENVLRGRVVDPTGAFVLYAGQYQPDEQAFLERADPPTFVAVTGKARTFQPDDSDQIFTSVRPESINEVDATTRDRWNVQAARATIDRIDTMAAALASGYSGDNLRSALLEAGVADHLAHGIPLALDHYGTTATYLQALREVALETAELVADRRDEVGPLDIEVDDAGEVRPTDVGGDLIELPEPAPVETAADPSADEASSDEEPSETDVPGSAGGDEASPESAAESTDTTASSEMDAGQSESETPIAASAPEATDADESDSSTVTPETGDVSDATDREVESTTTDVSTEGNDPDSPGSEDEADADDLGDFSEEGFDLEDETREEIEEEYGTEFQSGTEVDEPGSANIDPEGETPADATTGEPSEGAGDDADTASETGAHSESGTATDPESGAENTDGHSATVSGEQESIEAPQSTGEDQDRKDDATGTEATAEDDVTAAESATEDGQEAETLHDVKGEVLSVMKELDQGDGADRSAVVSAMTDRYAVDAAAVEDAIQEALMDGECYEPDDSRLKPI